MSPGADLFVVCKRCGSEVSPYITECPYCGTRLRKRAPKIERDGVVASGRHRLAGRAPRLGRLRRGEIPGIRAESFPYATLILVLGACGVWVAWHGGFVSPAQLIVIGPLHGDAWRLVTSQFSYVSGYYEFATLAVVGIFGWLLERRVGPLVVAAVFLAGGVTGALAEVAIYSSPLAGGANGGALALLGAWSVPDLLALRHHRLYEGDLVGAGVCAAAILAMSAARPEASLVEAVVGGMIGLVLGAGIAQVTPP
jgi:Rhomboid family